MKKLFTFFAVATFVVALSSCGGAKNEETATDATEVSDVTNEPAPVDAPQDTTVKTDSTSAPVDSAKTK